MQGSFGSPSRFWDLYEDLDRHAAALFDGVDLSRGTGILAAFQFLRQRRGETRGLEHHHDKEHSEPHGTKYARFAGGGQSG